MEEPVTRYGKRSGGPWYGEDFPRIVFEREARLHFPGFSGMTVTTGHEAGRRYQLLVNVPHYEARHVQILFQRKNPSVPLVSADGPVQSKHRFPSGELCMWHPDDPVENRWIFNDGFMALVGHIATHLFREAWWRETGEWLGPEVGHSSAESARQLKAGVLQ